MAALGKLKTRKV